MADIPDEVVLEAIKREALQRKKLSESIGIAAFMGSSKTRLLNKDFIWSTIRNIEGYNRHREEGKCWEIHQAQKKLEQKKRESRDKRRNSKSVVENKYNDERKFWEEKRKAAKEKDANEAITCFYNWEDTVPSVYNPEPSDLMKETPNIRLQESQSYQYAEIDSSEEERKSKKRKNKKTKKEKKEKKKKRRIDD